MIDLRVKPFNLNEQQIEWVKTTFESLTVDEKIGQLFCPILFTKEKDELVNFLLKYKPGGILYREAFANELYNANKILQENSRIPLLIAANLESGGCGAVLEGTYYGRQMLVSATQDNSKAYELGKISCEEAKSVGVNWAFAPVVDLDLNYHNPIINVRSFGKDVNTVSQMSLCYTKAASESGVIACPKHFPGDGVDERDQHLLTSVNSFSCEEWDSSYGKIYKDLINSGVLSIMAGHIALPAYEEKFDKSPCNRIVPATLSKNILQKLLREQLNFNGLIVTDATPMVGFCSVMERKLSVPLTIENGCDMFLFNKNIDEDYQYMKDGYNKGILSEQRLNDAVLRILAVKAAVNLHIKQKEKSLVPDKAAMNVIACRKHLAMARDCADKGVTLVKNLENIIPVNVRKHKRVLLEILGDFTSNARVQQIFIDKLKNEGFEVTLYKNEGFEVLQDTVEQFKSKYDLVLYVANIETASNKTTARVNWHTMFGMGNNIPWMVCELPVVFVSIGNPYHLLDVPMVKTYINGYCNSEFVIEAIINKLLGKSEFLGKSPVDPFCGRKDLRL